MKHSQLKHQPKQAQAFAPPTDTVDREFSPAPPQAERALPPNARSTRSLPIRASSGAIRRSTRGRWRALVLILVHVVFVAHFLHWRYAGRTVTPVEPSEAMQTLEQGLVNAGFVFFAAAILSTLVLGRWFCGWGCHLVALQDLCTWLLKRAGLRPRPFRSRLLVWVPLGAALYMFVWPTVRRWWFRERGPTWLAHFTGDDFWATFPGPVMAVVTLAVCGFGIVYLLGNKGFCTYACPYGGFFGLADRFAPGRIRVTSDCNGCGHCTAVCTSNIRVHEEVRRHGKVVDPGCMKCTDCVSVCPNDALYFGFRDRRAPAAIERIPPERPAARRFDYTWWEEALLAALFIAGLYVWRGLFDAVPFLLALGLSAISAFVLLQGLRLLRRPNMQFHGVQLRLQQRFTTAGRAFLTANLILFAALAYAGWLQWHVREGRRLLARSEAAQQQIPRGSAETAALVAQSLRRLDYARRLMPVGSARLEAQLGGLYLFQDDELKAEQHLRRALALEPGFGAARHRWAELLARRGDLPAAFAELNQALHDNPGLPDARRDLLTAAKALGRMAETVQTLKELAARRPADVQIRLDLVEALAQAGQLPEAEAAARRTVADRPKHVPARLRLALLLAERDDLAGAIAQAQETAALEPRRLDARLLLSDLLMAAGQVQVARTQLEAAHQIAPQSPAVVQRWQAAQALRDPAKKRLDAPAP